MFRGVLVRSVNKNMHQDRPALLFQCVSRTVDRVLNEF